MDPNQCLADLIVAACKGDMEGMRFRSGDLLAWLAIGGFTPTIHETMSYLDPRSFQ